MSIRDYLSTLDKDQLQCAKKITDELIAKKYAEENVKLWVVSDGWTNKAAFLENDYEIAVDRLCAEINKQAKEMPGHEIELTLNKCRFIESEVQGMLDL